MGTSHVILMTASCFKMVKQGWHIGESTNVAWARLLDWVSYVG